MKYIAESKRTISTLETWAGSGKLYTASYYFWNQGNEMQKSRLGLMQSLLYQLLRKEPQLIPSVDRKNLQHEHWEMSELIAAFERVSSSTQLDSKFCFFIDGLDEYDGDESDILPMLQIISASSHIKVCASSRPERIYDKTLRSDQWAFNIAKFTLNDMRQYVSKQLNASEKFRALASTDQKCHDLISDISEHADGVWLWVFLVTRDIIYEVDRDEPLSTLVKIVTQFPANLDEYFKRIIEKIKDVHKEEMAQTFLVTTHELQPMPLYAFALLQQERTNPNFFVEGGPKPISESIILKQHPIWRSRVQNRCGDLLVVED